MALHADLNPFGNLKLQLVVINHLGDRADDSTAGDNPVTAPDSRQHFLMLLHFFLLRPNQQKIEDNENQDNRQKGFKSAGPGSLCACLCECRRSEHERLPKNGSREFGEPTIPAIPRLANAKANARPAHHRVSETMQSKSANVTAMETHELLQVLERIAAALERQDMSPTPGASIEDADAFVWHADPDRLEAVRHVNRLELDLLVGIDQPAEILLKNTRRFASSLPANNALLWGARGTGKSSLIKAVHGRVNTDTPHALALVEIHREDLKSLPRLLSLLRGSNRRCLLFCDDLSFDAEDASYKSLKAVLEGGIEGRPDNVLFYATSNRRHLMPRQMIDNERSTAIHPAEATEEKVSLSDRFGLWLGFHGFDQATYLAIVERYAERFNLPIAADALTSEALTWAQARGGRSGRVAWQFIQDLAGRLEKRLDEQCDRSEDG